MGSHRPGKLEPVGGPRGGVVAEGPERWRQAESPARPFGSRQPGPKQFLSEEKMAARFNTLSLENDHVYIPSPAASFPQQSSLEQCPQPVTPHTPSPPGGAVAPAPPQSTSYLSAPRYPPPGAVSFLTTVARVLRPNPVSGSLLGVTGPSTHPSVAPVYPPSTHQAGLTQSRTAPCKRNESEFTPFLLGGGCSRAPLPRTAPGES
uniref:Uncharacterized protein n=1 Tax=Chelydra serpentina TaxID=8475 RepID=A0A8C3SU98_CHESE